MLQRPALALALALAVAACGGADAPSETTPDPAQPTEPSPAAASSLEGMCVRVFERQRECTDEFIPALVDARIRADVPAGIAARAEAGERDALIAEARGEWANDSKDEAIQATCSRIAGSLSPEQAQQAQESMSTCLATSACGEFVACIVPNIEKRLSN